MSPSLAACSSGAGVPPADEGASRPLIGLLFRPSAFLAFFAGVLTPFTVSLGGEMPLGELLLFIAAAWAVLIVALSHAWPGELWRDPVFLGLMACQAAALAAYVFSDLYRGSDPRDFVRGWARMVFLAIDLAAVAYLVGCSALNFVLLLVGVQLGEVLKAHLEGALFGDFWKFGYALPVTVGALLLAGRFGLVVSGCVTAALGLLHFTLDYRSLGLLCLLVATLVGVQAFPRAIRAWIAPVGLACGLALCVLVYARTRTDHEGQRSTRSDVERSSMMLAALESVRDSPFIGQGSWFSRARVIENFMIIREEKARLAGVGGFLGANQIEDDPLALHSQLLVTLAEGGLFGAAFFIPYVLALVWALHDQVVVRDWTPFSALRHLVLSLALFHAFFSPFSGAHRVGIALATILVVLVRRERVRSRAAPESDTP